MRHRLIGKLNPCLILLLPTKLQTLSRAKLLILETAMELKMKANVGTCSNARNTSQSHDCFLAFFFLEQMSELVQTPNKQFKLILCVLGLLAFFLLYGIAQERLMTTEYGNCR
jgi:hypothetical protein